MKYLYIAGMEHSGTTLLNHLLCQGSEVLGLGEVASFFSTEHMTQYMARWGSYPDVRLCSCGDEWERCRFWKALAGLNGLCSTQALATKYTHLVQHVLSEYKQIKLIVDSSKSRVVVRRLLDNLDEIGIAKTDFSVLHMAKDVRGFSASVSRRQDQPSTLLGNIRTYNWWLHENRKFSELAAEPEIDYHFVLYEKLCEEPQACVTQILNACGVDFPGEVDVSHNSSHIAMGNKDFAIRNRDRIRYDSAWYLDDSVNLAYLVHAKARSFNKTLYSASIC